MVIRNFAKLTNSIIKKTGNRSKKFREKLERNFKNNVFNGKTLMSYSVKKNKKGEWDIDFNWSS